MANNNDFRFNYLQNCCEAFYKIQCKNLQYLNNLKQKFYDYPKTFNRSS